jgi:hypothetical protein
MALRDERRERRGGFRWMPRIWNPNPTTPSPSKVQDAMGSAVRAKGTLAAPPTPAASMRALRTTGEYMIVWF